MNTVLVVEDQEDLRFAIRRFLERQGYGVSEAATVEAASASLRDKLPDLAILDHNLPDGDGLEVLRRIKLMAPGVPALMLTGHGSIELAVAAIKEGAHQFLTKPVKFDVLGLMIERLLDTERALRANQGTRLARSQSDLDPFVGDSELIGSLREKAKRVAQSQVPVLIEGATGTGKGVLARWLHDHGPRSEESVVELNCAGLSKELLESELFGHEKGAFTGAAATKAGLLDIAHRGTLFLDEIGDMDLEVQPRLLKVIEEQRFRRLGAVRERRVEVRLIAATHHDLAARAKEGRFRLDLLYRINAIRLVVPLLKDRGSDLIHLARVLIERLGRELDRPQAALSADAEAALLTHDWPGNVRELRNVLERALLFAASPTLEPSDLGLSRSGTAYGSSPGGAPTLKQSIKRAIEEALVAHGHDVARAAAQLDVSRSALYKMMRRHEIPARRASRARS
ncbi:MAG: sigma-54 dependent transcriptional regulator [Acidobacteriota bacterium]